VLGSRLQSVEPPPAVTTHHAHYPLVNSLSLAISMRHNGTCVERIACDAVTIIGRRRTPQSASWAARQLLISVNYRHKHHHHQSQQHDLRVAQMGKGSGCSVVCFVQDGGGGLASLTRATAMCTAAHVRQNPSSTAAPGKWPARASVGSVRVPRLPPRCLRDAAAAAPLAARRSPLASRVAHLPAR